MLQQLDSLPREMLGLRVKGPLAIDALGRFAGKGASSAIILEVDDTGKHDFWDVWRSMRYALAHYRQNYRGIDRIAVVSDTENMHRISALNYPLLHGVPEKTFFTRARNQAVQWAAGQAVPVS